MTEESKNKRQDRIETDHHDSLPSSQISYTNESGRSPAEAKVLAAKAAARLGHSKPDSTSHEFKQSTKRNRVTSTSSNISDRIRAGSILSRRRTGSVLSRKQVANVKWHRFLDACCGSLLQRGSSKKATAEMEELKQESKVDYHRVPLNQLLSRLHTNLAHGLDKNEVRYRLDKYGLNQMKPPPQTPEWYKFVKQLVSGFGILLWIGAALCFIAYGIQSSVMESPPLDYVYIGVVLVTVILMTAIFSYYQEAKSSKIMDTFKKLLPQSATVLRDGADQTVPVEELVIGDIVRIKGGDKIPADCRVVNASSLKVDNSSLTGESEPQMRSAECTNNNILETRNMLFFSTFAVEGTSTAVVVATGDNTVMGRIARLTSGIQSKKTPLAIELERFVKLISVFAVTIGIVFLIIVLSLGIYWLDGVVFVIGIIVANVPEGLLIQVTLTLSLTAKSMAKHNALVKNLEAVETLGSTSTICSDKTGTLTQNRMTVAHLWLPDHIFAADLSRDQKDSAYDKKSNSWRALMKISALCSRAVFKPKEQQHNYDDILQRECIGDGSESALLKFGELALGSVDKVRTECSKVVEIPFSSATKVQISIHNVSEDDPDDSSYYHLVMKGAPERIIDACSTALLYDGQEVEITEEFKASFTKAYETLGGMGERVLGFCDMKLPADLYPEGFAFQTEPEPNFSLTGLRFVGLISMIDPPRPAVPDAVRKCRQAGIKVIMVTGDHPITATAIARAVGIVSPTSKTVEEIAAERGVPVDQVNPADAIAATIHGHQLRDMSSEQLDKVIATHQEIVFARTSPQQKLLIVEGFQRAGAIVAVTGDGVNDSPALKKADIGVAMGIAGSDVSKQAADMILMDDNFATIVFAVEEGRVLFDNLKKCICYILTSNIPELAAPLAYVIFAIPAPLGTVPMLAIDLGTDFVPAVTYAYEPAESDIMRRKPRHPVNDKLVNNRMMSIAYGQHGFVEAAAGFMAYFVVMCENGFLLKKIYGLRPMWDAKGLNDLEDSYGQEWTFHQRKSLEYTIYSTYFVAVVVMQWCDLVICKTRRMSLFHQGWTNHWQTFGLVFETCVAVLICYTPGVTTALNMLPVRGLWWLIAMPFAFFLFVYDQCRKWAIRRLGETAWVTTEFYF